MTGKVKWFNESKGFGFIIPDDGSTEVFVHYKDIQVGGYKSLYDGQKVEYDLYENPRGRTAKNVRPSE